MLDRSGYRECQRAGRAIEHPTAAKKTTCGRPARENQSPAPRNMPCPLGDFPIGGLHVAARVSHSGGSIMSAPAAAARRVSAAPYTSHLARVKALAVAASVRAAGLSVHVAAAPVAAAGGQHDVPRTDGADGVSGLPAATRSLLAALPDDLRRALEHTCSVLVRYGRPLPPLPPPSTPADAHCGSSRVGSRVGRDSFSRRRS
jgi:hypothetical protein